MGEGEMIKGRRKKGMGEDAQTVKVERGTPGLGHRELGKLGGVQGGWERCRKAASRESGRCSGQGGFQKCREVSRSAGIGRPRGWRGCRHKCREVGKQCREKRGLRLAQEPGRMQEQERSCKQGRSGSLGPYGCGPGPSIGLPPGEDGPKAAPNRKKSLGMRAEPLTYTLWERRGRDRQRRWG